MESKLYLLPLAASLCLIIALIQAWLMTMVRYLKFEFIKKIFPGYKYLVKSHIDYLMMSSLIFCIYLVFKTLNIVPPSFIAWLIFIGALYNPLGFLLQAIKPDIAKSDSYASKTGVVIGFIPLTIGLFWSTWMIIITLFEKI